MGVIEVSETVRVHMLLFSVAIIDTVHVRHTVHQAFQLARADHMRWKQSKFSIYSPVSMARFCIETADSGGALGGFANAIADHIFEFMRLSGDHGWITHLHEHGEDEKLHYTQHRIMWGAVWGLLFCAPLHKRIGNFWLRCTLFALIPTIVGLFWTIPANDKDAGFFSLGLGFLTPLFVLFSYTFTWAVPGYLWVGLSGFGGTIDTSLRGGEADAIVDVDNLLP